MIWPVQLTVLWLSLGLISFSVIRINIPTYQTSLFAMAAFKNRCKCIQSNCPVLEVIWSKPEVLVILFSFASELSYFIGRKDSCCAFISCIILISPSPHALLHKGKTSTQLLRAGRKIWTDPCMQVYDIEQMRSFLPYCWFGRKKREEKERPMSYFNNSGWSSALCRLPCCGVLNWSFYLKSAEIRNPAQNINLIWSLGQCLLS